MELYARRMMIDMFICRHKGDYNEELALRFDIACTAPACDYPSLECDSFAYGDRRYTLIRDPQTSLMLPQGQAKLVQPTAGCLVLYYVTPEAPMEVANSTALFMQSASPAADHCCKPPRPSHFGIVSEVSQKQIKVRSKWGETDVYIHSLWDVITPYGNAAIFLAPP